MNQLRFEDVIWCKCLTASLHNDMVLMITVESSIKDGVHERASTTPEPMKHFPLQPSDSPRPPTRRPNPNDWSTCDKTNIRKAQFHCRILTPADYNFPRSATVSAFCVFVRLFLKSVQFNLYIPCYLPLVVCCTMHLPFVTTDYHAAEWPTAFILY